MYEWCHRCILFVLSARQRRRIVCLYVLGTTNNVCENSVTLRLWHCKCHSIKFEIIKIEYHIESTHFIEYNTHSKGIWHAHTRCFYLWRSQGLFNPCFHGNISFFILEPRDLHNWRTVSSWLANLYFSCVQNVNWFVSPIYLYAMK